MSPSRRLAAILAADIAGYSALMGSDEAHGRRRAQLEESVAQYLSEHNTADRHELTRR